MNTKTSDNTEHKLTISVDQKTWFCPNKNVSLAAADLIQEE